MRRLERTRGWLSLLLWCGFLATGLVLFHAVGDGPLAGPPPDPSTWSTWMAERDGLVATAALLRLSVLALTWYLVGATAVGLVARLARSVRAVRFADALTVPVLRRLLQATVGLSLATGVVVSAVPASVAVAREPRAVVADEADETPGGTESAGTRPHVMPTGKDAVPPPLRLLRGHPSTTSAAEPEGWPQRLRSRPDAPGEPPPLRRLDVPVNAADVPAAGMPDDRSRSNSAPAPGGREVVLRHLGSSGADEGVSGDLRTDDGRVPGRDTSDPPERGDEHVDALPSWLPGLSSLPDEGSAERPVERPSDPTQATAEQHIVVAGESLWTIARDVVAGGLGRAPTDAEIVDYWLDLIEAQRPFLANPDDPDLIFPGERVRLPATVGRWHG